MSEPCLKTDKINRLEADIISINDRMNRHSDKIDKVSDNNLVLETILKRLEDDSKEQKQQNAEVNRTMLSIQAAMTEITFNVRELNNKLVETNEKVDVTNSKVEVTNTKINKIDEKSKVDFLEILKSKIIPILFGGGCVFGLVEFIKSLVG